MFALNSRLRFYTVLFTAVLIGVRAQSAEIPEEVIGVIQERVNDGKTVGIVVGVVDAEGTVFYSYGKKRTGEDAMPDEHSVFEIGSISKVFTATLLADAVQRGEVKYDDPIQRYLPEGVKVPTRGGQSITLEHLSVQNSGLPRMPGNFSPKQPLNPYADYSVEELYEALGALELTRDIGEEYEYSNLGVGLLGHLLERASGMGYEALVKARIADVLDMPDTVMTLTDPLTERLAIGHVNRMPTSNWDIPTLAGAGAIRSTATDMIAFLKANLGLTNSTLLESMRDTHTARASAGSSSMQIGLGWHILPTPEGQIIHWHNGGTGGYRSFAGFTQDPPRGVVVLTNSGGAGDDDIGLHILDSTLHLAGVTDYTEVEIDPELLGRYVGNYELAPGAILYITQKDDQLFARLTGQPRNPIYPKADDSFFFKVVDAQLTFKSEGDANAHAVVLHQGGQNTEAKRQE